MRELITSFLVWLCRILGVNLISQQEVKNLIVYMQEQRSTSLVNLRDSLQKIVKEKRRALDLIQEERKPVTYAYSEMIRTGIDSTDKSLERKYKRYASEVATLSSSMQKDEALVKTINFLK